MTRGERDAYPEPPPIGPFFSWRHAHLKFKQPSFSTPFSFVHIYIYIHTYNCLYVCISGLHCGRYHQRQQISPANKRKRQPTQFSFYRGGAGLGALCLRFLPGCGSLTKTRFGTIQLPSPLLSSPLVPWDSLARWLLLRVLSCASANFPFYSQARLSKNNHHSSQPLSVWYYRTSLSLSLSSSIFFL